MVGIRIMPRTTQVAAASWLILLGSADRVCCGVCALCTLPDHDEFDTPNLVAQVVAELVGDTP